MKASGVRVDSRSDNLGLVVELRGKGIGRGELLASTGGTAAGLPAVTATPGGMLFCARTISGRLFPRPATCRTACVIVGSWGQVLMLKIAQSPVFEVLRSWLRLAKSVPSPAHAAGAPYSDMTAIAPASRANPKNLIDTFML